MRDKIKNILSNFKGIDGWRINESSTQSSELFFVKKELDMNRAKDVHHFLITVYKDFEEDGVKYKGSSTTNIHPTMSDEEIKKAIEDAAFAASLVKNKYYPLVEATNIKQPSVKNKLEEAPISEWVPKVIEAIYNSDNYEDGCINSVELFLEKISKNIVNSEGVNVSFDNYKGQIELITNWKETEEEIELYKYIEFSDFDRQYIDDSVNNLLKMSRDKAIAKVTPDVKDIPVLLTGEPVKEFFNYYYEKANVKNIYEETSTFKVGECVQGNEVKGDKINITLDPFMENSTYSRPYDSEGCPLQAVDIYKDGELKSYWGSNRFSHYLDVKPTGIIENIDVSVGNKSIEELRNEPYLEVAVFSDFQMDTMTGDFAGEIRLGWYHDGKNTIPVTSGSISANIKDVQQEMYLSKESQQINNFRGPKSIKLLNVTIAGRE